MCPISTLGHAGNHSPHAQFTADVSQMNAVCFRGQLVTLKINLILVWTRFTLNPGTALPQHAKMHFRGASFFFFNNSDKVMRPESVYSNLKSLGSVTVSFSPQDWYHWPVCKLKGCSLRMAGLALQTRWTPITSCYLFNLGNKTLNIKP